LDEAAGYGRIVRDVAGNLERIVEHADATADELALHEVNSGVYVFDAKLLASALSRVGTSNAQGEQYLTDVIGILREDGHTVRAVVTEQDNILGVNDRRQLSHVGRVLRDRIVTHWQLAGVTIVDPQTTWIERSVTLEADAVILPNVTLAGLTTVAAGASVGPDCSLTDTQVAKDAQVVRTTANGAIIGAKATVGPYTYLRPGTVLGVGAKAGGFVEMKNSISGPEETCIVN
jgi:bifunctional UDP-N-acetylglucosamine pyrophosphorylase/glucosamine-1-phosphate N-acetyltransferase